MTDQPVTYDVSDGVATDARDDLVGGMKAAKHITPLEEESEASIRRQLEINLRAVIGDVRSEIEGFSRSAHEIATVLFPGEGPSEVEARAERNARRS